MLRINNKKGMSISVVLLVVLTLILVVLTLAYFITSGRQSSAVFNVPGEIDSVYDDSIYFNVYLSGMFERATNGFKFSDGKTGFLEKFKSETEKTLFYSRYGNTITYSSVVEDSIELTKDKIVLNIDIIITNNEIIDKGMTVKYSYRKTSEKKFDY